MGNPWKIDPWITWTDFPWIDFAIFHEFSGRPDADKKCGGVWVGGGGSPLPQNMFTLSSY